MYFVSLQGVYHHDTSILLDHVYHPRVVMVTAQDMTSHDLVSRRDNDLSRYDAVLFYIALHERPTNCTIPWKN